MDRDLFNDPFFAAHNEQIRQMTSMFGGGFPSPFMSLEGGQAPRGRPNGGGGGQELASRDPFGNDSLIDSFGAFGNMHRVMNTMMQDMNTRMTNVQEMGNGADGHSYTHSSVMTYSNSGQGQPKVFQASTSTAKAPGGIKETRKMLRDSDRGVEKMAVGRHIRDRAYIQTKERDRSGQMNEDEQLLNIDDRSHFEDEWRSHARTFADRTRQLDGGAGRRPSNHASIGRQELSYTPSTDSARSSAVPAIENVKTVKKAKAKKSLR